MDMRRLLIASGDLDFIEQIASSLDGRGFTVFPAYSHKDALYQLRNDLFALVIVDARLIHRETGEPSLHILQKTFPRPPILVYGSGDSRVNGYAEMPLLALDEATVRTTVLRALRIPRIEPPATETLNRSTAFNPLEGGGDDVLPTSIYWRDDQIRTLFALSRSLTESLDLSEVLNRVVEAARRLTNAEEGMILLPDEHSAELYLRARVGMDAQVAENFRIKTQDTLAGTAYTTGQTVLVNAGGPQKVKTEYFVYALLYVPIMLNGIPLGVLGVNNRQRRDPFTEQHRELLVNLASYAAIAINNARTHGESVRRAHELKLLVDASQSVNATLSFDKTLAAVCESLSRVLNVHVAALYDISDDHRWLNLRAAYKQSRWRAGTEETLTCDARILEALARAGMQTISLTDQDEWGRDVLDRAGAQTALLLPMVHGDTVFGVLFAYYQRASAVDLPRSRLQRAQRALSDSGQVLVGGTSDRTTSTAYHILGDLRAILDADSLEFAVTVADRPMLRVRYAYGSMVWVDKSRTAHFSEPIAFGGDYTFGYSIEDTIPIEAAHLLLRRWVGCSVLALPLKVRGNVQGVAIMIDTMRTRDFQKREVDLARAMISQAGTAIDNAQLVVDLERSLRDLRSAQQKLVQSARLSAMGELAAAVAHQINNPLTTIVLDTELLMDDPAQSETTIESLKAILRAGKRASGVVRRLLSSARPGSEDAPPVPVDVLLSIQETIALVFPYMERAQIQIRVTAPESALPQVMAPPGALDDVWLNLLLNAHDVLQGRGGGRIEVLVDYQAQSSTIAVMVRDNGPGIPEAILERIFEPFFTTKAHGEGTGLGLYICKEIVARVGGTIGVESSPQGATFIIHLPL